MKIIMTQQYEWKMPSFAKGIDANDAVTELNRIEKEYGSLTPENVLEASKSETALFHNLFTWNNDEAANQYRLEQARRILNNIEITVLADEEPKQIPAYELIRKDGTRSYKSIEKFDSSDIEQIRSQAIKELNIWRNKLTIYTQFSKAVKKIGESIDLLNK